MLCAAYGCVYIENGFVCVAKSPYQYQANHDGVSALVVYLDGLGVEVAGAEAYILCTHKGVDPVKTVLSECTYVFAEESHHFRLVGLKHRETATGSDGHDEEQG